MKIRLSAPMSKVAAWDPGDAVAQTTHAGATTNARDRRRLLRTIIEEVQLTTDEQHHHVRIVWKGGAVTDRDVVQMRQPDESF